MIGLLQRVTQARVEVEGQTIGQIEQGLLVLLGIEKNDCEASADNLLRRILSYRVFEDTHGKMNLDLRHVHGELLIVPQFTLPADTRKGSRPSFTPAASPEEAKQLYSYFVTQARQQHPAVATGQFGADMQITLTNDGPVTFWLQTATGN